jgi:peroxiredoxin
MTGLKYGAPAPDFTLPTTPTGPTVSLSGLKGSDIVLVFYCYDFGSI